MPQTVGRGKRVSFNEESKDITKTKTMTTSKTSIL